MTSSSFFWKELYALVKRETTYGVDPSPVGTDAVLLRNVSFDALKGNAVDRGLILPYMGSSPKVMTQVRRGAGFEFELAGSGTPGTIPAFSALLRSGGLAETVVAAGTIQASPATNVGTPVGTFTYTNTGAYTGTASRLVTLLCTTAGGTGVAKFTVSSPASYGQGAVSATAVTMTNATPFTLANGATITPNIGTAFALNDTYTIQIDPPRVEYTPITFNMDSATAYFGIRDQQRIMTGARGKLSMAIEGGKVPYMNWDGEGLFVASTTTAAPTTNMTAWKAPTVVSKDSASITIQGFAAIAKSFQLSSNANAGYLERIGYGKVVISDRPWAGSCVFELPGIADFDIEGIAKAGTLGAVKVVHGLAGGNIIQVDLPNAQLMNPKFAKGDMDIWEVTCDVVALPLVGNDDVKLTFK